MVTQEERDAKLKQLRDDNLEMMDDWYKRNVRWRYKSLLRDYEVGHWFRPDLHPLQGFRREWIHAYDQLGESVERVTVEKIAGHNGAFDCYRERWIPDPGEFYSPRYQRILRGACFFEDGHQGHFLSTIGVIGLFYLEDRDEYYVMTDGHRRVSVAHMLFVNEIQAEVTRCVRK